MATRVRILVEMNEEYADPTGPAGMTVEALGLLNASIEPIGVIIDGPRFVEEV